jgi:hypothetical protein
LHFPDTGDPLGYEMTLEKQRAHADDDPSVEHCPFDEDPASHDEWHIDQQVYSSRAISKSSFRYCPKYGISFMRLFFKDL